MLDLFVEIYSKGFSSGESRGAAQERRKHAQAALAETRAAEQRRNEHVDR
jgi:hypothetical protein